MAFLIALSLSHLVLSGCILEYTIRQCIVKDESENRFLSIVFPLS